MKKFILIALLLPLLAKAQHPYIQPIGIDSVGHSILSPYPLSQVAISGYFSNLVNKPTSLAGYGITDAYPLTSNPAAYLTSVSLPNVGTPGTYTKVTTDAQGRVSTGASLAVSDIPLTLVYNTLKKTANYTILSTDFTSGSLKQLVCYVDASGGNVTITMPSTITGALIVVKKTDSSSNTVTVSGVLGNNTILTQYQSRTFDNDSTNWYNQ